MLCILMVHPYINQMLETASIHAPTNYSNDFSACNNVFIQIEHQLHFLLEPKTIITSSN